MTTGTLCEGRFDADSAIFALARTGRTLRLAGPREGENAHYATVRNQPGDTESADPMSDKRLERQFQRAAERPDDREARIADLERQLAALKAEEDEASTVQVVEKPTDAERIDALEQQLADVVGRAQAVVPYDQRPAIQVIQRTEVESGGKKKRKPTEAEEKANMIMAGGCAIAMIIFAAWCTSLGCVLLL